MVGHVSIADWAVAAEFFVALLALIFFVVGYIASTRGRALKTPEGRHLITFRSSLAVFMGMGVVHSLVGPYPGRDAVRVIVVGAFALAALGGDILMTRAQLRRRRDAAGRHR